MPVRASHVGNYLVFTQWFGLRFAKYTARPPHAPAISGRVFDKNFHFYDRKCIVAKEWCGPGGEGGVGRCTTVSLASFGKNVYGDSVKIK